MSQMIIDRTSPLQFPEEPRSERDVVLDRIDRLLGELAATNTGMNPDIEAAVRVRSLLSARIDPVPDSKKRSAFFMLGIVQGDMEPVAVSAALIMGRHQTIAPTIYGFQKDSLHDLKAEVDSKVVEIFGDAHKAFGS